MSGMQGEQKPGDWVAEAAPEVGERLRVAREARQLTLEEVAGILKLGVRQLEALESGRWESLPGATFIRGFVRNYARVVQVDPAPLMTQLDATLARDKVSLDVPENASGAMPTARGHARRHDRNFVILGVALVALAAVVYLLLPADLGALRDKAQELIDSAARKEAKPVAPAPVAAAPATDGAGAAAVPANTPDPVFPPGQTPQQVMNPQVVAPPQLVPAPATPAASASAGALRMVFSGESWVEVRDRDGKVLFSEKRAAGGEQSLDGAPPLALVIGKASAVTLTWRGKAVDLAPHTKGEVARLTLE